MLPTIFKDNSTRESYYVPDDVLLVLKLRYHIIMPILVALTLLSNTIALSITRKVNPKKNLHVNKYIKLMSITEICYALTLIPTLIDNEFCTYNSYIFAVYQAFLVQPAPYYFRYINNSLLVNLSMDRFLIIWFPHSFESIKRSTNVRLLIIWIWITISMLPHILLGNVLPEETQKKWVATRGYKNINHPWLKIYKSYSLISFVIIPLLLVIFLSIGMIIGIRNKLVNSPIRRSIGNSPEQKNRQKNYTFAVLASNIFYVGCIIPFALLVGRYKLEEGRCFSNIIQEIIKTIAFCFLMTWVIFNQLLFFMIHRDYRKHLRVLCSSCCCIKPSL